MQAGRLDRRIVVQRATTAQATNGEPVKTWATLATVWAEFLPQSGGREHAGAGAERVAWADTKFRLRYRPDITITTKDRVSYASKTFDILGVTEPERLRVVELLCQARADA